MPRYKAPTTKSPVNQARGKLAAASRNYGRQSPQALAAEAEFAAVRATAYIEQILAEAPPLTDEQRTRLAELLKPVRNCGDVGAT